MKIILYLSKLDFNPIWIDNEKNASKFNEKSNISYFNDRAIKLVNRYAQTLVYIVACLNLKMLGGF